MKEFLWSCGVIGLLIVMALLAPFVYIILLGAGVTAAGLMFIYVIYSLIKMEIEDDPD